MNLMRRRKKTNGRPDNVFSRNSNVADSDYNLDKMPYRTLQEIAKENGIPAGGKRADILARLKKAR